MGFSLQCTNIPHPSLLTSSTFIKILFNCLLHPCLSNCDLHINVVHCTVCKSTAQIKPKSMACCHQTFKIWIKYLCMLLYSYLIRNLLLVPCTEKIKKMSVFRLNKYKYYSIKKDRVWNVVTFDRSRFKILLGTAMIMWKVCKLIQKYCFLFWLMP